jgi:uncharacterized repeat protein (TIGR03943 family)
MSRETQNVLLLLVGLGTGLMVLKGTYVHYVKPSLLPWLVVASVVLTALALICIVRDIRSGGAAAGDIEHGAAAGDIEHGAAAGDTDGDDAHQHRGWVVWLLLVPVAVTAFVIPPPLGAHGATPAVAAAGEPHRRPYPPLPDQRAPVVSLPEVLMRAATDSAGTLDDRLITVTGFTMKGSAGPDLARVVIVCCAADAQLARLHLAGPAAANAAGHPEDTWLRVEGRLVPGSSTTATSFIPTLAVTTVTQIDRPANTYAY